MLPLLTQILQCTFVYKPQLVYGKSQVAARLGMTSPTSLLLQQRRLQSNMVCFSNAANMGTLVHPCPTGPIMRFKTERYS